jgi:2-hydroxy-3-keto-5-methylthiopentenyl-1-phosphate phosphatase
MLKTSLNDKEYSYVIKKLKKSLKKSLRKSLRKSRKPCKYGVNQYGCCNKKPTVKKTKRCLESSKRRSSPCKYGEDVNGCCNKKPTQKYVKKCRRSRRIERTRDLVGNKHIIKKIIKSLRKSRKPSNKNKSANFEISFTKKIKDKFADFKKKIKGSPSKSPSKPTSLNTEQKTTDLPINTKEINNQPNKIKKVVIFTDFDGTITRKPGKELFFTEEYKNLYNIKGNDNYPDKDSYISPNLFFNNNTKTEYFKAIVRDKTKDISEQAKNFLQWAVKRESNVDVVIISNNRIDYIKLMLEKNGIIDNYTILAFNKKGKGNAISNYINRKDSDNIFNQQYPSIIILDDNNIDFEDMKKAVDSYNIGNIIKSNIIYAENKKPEEYPVVWATLQNKIENDRNRLDHHSVWASRDRPGMSNNF